MCSPRVSDIRPQARDGELRQALEGIDWTIEIWNTCRNGQRYLKVGYRITRDKGNDWVGHRIIEDDDPSA